MVHDGWDLYVYWLVVDLPQPEKSWSEFVTWDDDIPNSQYDGKVIIQPCKPVTTNQQ